MAVTNLLCGQDGIFTRIKEAQNQVQQIVMLGKNFINAVETTIAEIETFIRVLRESPDKIISQLQQEALNIISVTALNNPEGAIAQILELRAKYQEAGPAVQRVLDNLEQFVRDPLNTPLDVCNDIPNLVQIGETFVEFPKKALQADPTKEVENIKETIINEYLNIFDNSPTISEEKIQTQKEQETPTAPKFPVPDVGNDVVLGGVIPPEIAFNPGPGQAQKAAELQAGVITPRPQARTAPAGAAAPASSQPAARAPAGPPPPTLANPFPEGKQFTATDFAPSRYAKNIAKQINSLHPVLRGRFAAGIQDYLQANHPGRDINITEGFRTPERSAQLRASGIRAAAAGRSWHNYGAAADVAIYVDGKWDDGRRGDREYTGLARASMQKYGLINDLRGDSGHFYIQAFGAGVPNALFRGETNIASLAASKGINEIASQPAPLTVANTQRTIVYDVTGPQRAARDKAIADALAQGKSRAEAESLGEIAGNRAGTEALRNIVL